MSGLPSGHGGAILGSVVFDLRDNPVTTSETDKRRGRIAVIVASVVLVLLGTLVVVFWGWLGARLDQSETRAQGDEVIDAIPWPEDWQRLTVGFRPAIPLFSDARPHWRQEIVTDVSDLSTAGSSVHDVLTAAGWVQSAGCTPTTCVWQSDVYRLDSLIETAKAGAGPCPQDRASCIRVKVMLTLTHPEGT